MTSHYDVAVIGAGAAGISAACVTHRAGLSTILFEASARIGGRAWTQTIDTMPLDLGCGWLHSADRNPFSRLASQSGFSLDQSPNAWGIQYQGLGFPPDQQRDANAAWAAFHRRLIESPPVSDRAVDALEPGSEWNSLADAMSGYMNGASLDRLSVADYLAYDHAASDANWRVREGYGSLIAAQLPHVRVSVANPVLGIDHSGRRIRVTTRSGTIEAHTVVVAVSTAALAKGTIAFCPTLDDHLQAAACLPLGLADKLFLRLLEAGTLEADSHLIGNPHSASTGSYYLRPFGFPVIEAFYGGAGALAIEEIGAAGAFAFAIEELVALFGSDLRSKLSPLIGSSWGRTDHIWGSYSHALPGHVGARAILARPANDRVFFAGEATHRFDFSTAHGAWDSGVRAGEEAITQLSVTRGE